jgi:hypothetical protein
MQLTASLDAIQLNKRGFKRRDEDVVVTGNKAGR